MPNEPRKDFVLKTFAGFFIGFGALLSLSISGNIAPMVKAIGTGVQGYIYATLSSRTCSSFCFRVPSWALTTHSAWIVGRAKITQSAAVIVVAGIGNLVGGIWRRHPHGFLWPHFGA